MMAGIKNVIFDFGGIIVDLNKQAAIDAFGRLGFDARTYIGKYVQSGIFNQLELGLIPPARFYDCIRGNCLYFHYYSLCFHLTERGKGNQRGITEKISQQRFRKRAHPHN